MSDRKEQKEQAAFESTTKGFGKKLLMKMGWKEGTGLGKESEGIVKPIEVTLRPKGTGLGFNEEPDTKKAHEELYRPTKEVGELAPHERPWKKSHKAPSKANKKEEEIYEMFPQSTTSTGTMKIIDMTGREARQVESLANYRIHDPLDESGQFPELVQAVHRISLRCQTDLKHLQVASFNNEQRLKQINSEMEVCQRMVDERRKELERKRAVQRIVEGGKVQVGLLRSAIVEATADIGEHWRPVLALLDRLETLNKQDPLLDHVKVALALVADPIRLMLSNWNPLNESDSLVEILHILSGYQFKLPANSMTSKVDLANQLIVKYWLPNVRSYLVNSFDPRDHRFALFIDRWIPLLKAESRKTLVDMIVVKKIEMAVEESSLEDLSEWVPAWRHFLVDELDLAAIVRRRLCKCVERVDLRCLKDTVSRWNDVLPKREHDLFLMRAVIPKLSMYLDRSLVIDPANQDIEPLVSVLEWSDTIPVEFLVDILKNSLFPKLRRALHAWITGADADFGEITEWYGAWKSVLPDELGVHPVIAEEFAYLLVMMDELVDDPTLPITKFL